MTTLRGRENVSKTRRIEEEKRATRDHHRLWPPPKTDPPTPPPAPPRAGEHEYHQPRTLCVLCGPDVLIDEDGCCQSCGACAHGPWVSRIRITPYHPKEQQQPRDRVSVPIETFGELCDLMQLFETQATALLEDVQREREVRHQLVEALRDTLLSPALGAWPPPNVRAQANRAIRAADALDTEPLCPGQTGAGDKTKEE